MPYREDVIIDTSFRKVTQKPRKTDSVRAGNKSESQDKDLDYIQKTCAIVKEMRHTREYTQPDIAKKTGIKQQMISRIDRNDINPRLSTIKKYLAACGVNLDELLAEALKEMQESK